jgi:diaminohydroxyphosphoribosylaminopyrimidine deaminase/5-amino-6-(5-phosphoribosylamino)uracil reductase
MTSDEEYMREALDLARKGLGKTSPNPAVGALIVKNGKIIGRGYHKKAGEKHAEISALQEAGDAANGATMYVTLEPCNHHGKTPPCTEAIIKACICRVVVGAQDPNPKVAGKGIAKLERAGMDVESGLFEGESKRMNEMYEKYITTKKPFVIAKAALSADGKMAAKDGSSKWITGEEARVVVHELRAQVDAVMVGIDTVLKDDPSLTARIAGAKNPKRIVLDRKLKIRANSKVLNQEADTIIVTTHNAPMNRIEALRRRGVEVIIADEGSKGSKLRGLLKELANMEITSLMIEGGGKVIGSAIDERIVDKVMLFISPKILGGDGTMIMGDGANSIGNAINLKRVEMKRVGGELLLTDYPVN